MAVTDRFVDTVKKLILQILQKMVDNLFSVALQEPHGIEMKTVLKMFQVPSSTTKIIHGISEYLTEASIF